MQQHGAIDLGPKLANRHRGAVGAAGRHLQAVILAAGRGSRLAGLTDSRPKCLVEVGGSSLLDHQLEALARVGVRDVTVVTGYRAGDVRRVVGGRARIVANEDWDSTNSLYSVSLCRDRVRGDMLVMNCDVLAHPLAFERLLAQGPNAFLYDSTSGDSDEHMKVELRHGRLAAMSKALPAHRSHGENVGVLLFDAAATRSLFRHAGDLLAEGRRDVWMAAAVERLAASVPLRGVDVADLPWCEIDFPADLEHARAHVWPRLSPAALGEPRRLLAA
jgi:L-glutamine-phosphate cytidylyltransferase